MYFQALATDYDGTLAHDGIVAPQTVQALRELKDSGRRLFLVTGREVSDLLPLFAEMTLFDLVVAENGGVLYDPATGRERVLGERPPEQLVEALKAAGVAHLSVGRSVVATWDEHRGAVLEVIRMLGLEWHVSFNKGAVMILPAGVNKSTGLRAALDECGLSFHNVVSVGDAENDQAFLAASGCGAAVANALPALRQRADIVLSGEYGAGVVELVARMIADDGALATRAKHGMLLGRAPDGAPVFVEPFGGSVLIAAPSGCGKSRRLLALMEHLAERHFQFCVIDPEGDYVRLRNTIGVGGMRSPPHVAEAILLLDGAVANLVVNLQALDLPGRQSLSCVLLREALHLRARTGRPHWLLVDEAHQIFPASAPMADFRSGLLRASVLVTAYPEALSRDVLGSVEVVLTVGAAGAAVLDAIAPLLGVASPASAAVPGAGQILLWKPRLPQPPMLVDVRPPLQAHTRHEAKYAQGRVPANEGFYFRDAGGRYVAGAWNLYEFIDQAVHVGDEIWMRHLRAGDYARWFRDVIKDGALARVAAALERDRDVGAADSRTIIGDAVRRRYAAPSDRP